MRRQRVPERPPTRVDRARTPRPRGLRRPGDTRERIREVLCAGRTAFRALEPSARRKSTGAFPEWWFRARARRTKERAWRAGIVKNASVSLEPRVTVARRLGAARARAASLAPLDPPRVRRAARRSLVLALRGRREHPEGQQQASSTTATAAGAAARRSRATPSQSPHPVATRSAEARAEARSRARASTGRRSPDTRVTRVSPSEVSLASMPRAVSVKPPRLARASAARAAASAAVTVFGASTEPEAAALVAP